MSLYDLLGDIQAQTQAARIGWPGIGRTATIHTLEYFFDFIIINAHAVIRNRDNDVIIDRASVNIDFTTGQRVVISVAQQMVKEFFGREPHRGVNPDEVVAVGAAIQAGVLGGEVKDLLLLDVTPLSLGIETLGGVFTRLIERNTTIPTRKSEIFSTASDNQTSVEVHVLQGERSMAGQNRTLGKFHLVGIPPAPRGMPQVEVTFDIDANGIVNVSAKDLGTGREQKITITASSGLSQEEIDRMMRDAESHADEDKNIRERIEARNKLDGMIYATEKTLSEHRDKVDASTVSDIEAALAEAKGKLDSSDAGEINAAYDHLVKTSHKLAEIMYQQASQGGPPPGGDAGASGAAAGGSSDGGDDVIDAESVDVDDKKE